MGLRFFVVPVHDSSAFEQELNGQYSRGLRLYRRAENDQKGRRGASETAFPRGAWERKSRSSAWRATVRSGAETRIWADIGPSLMIDDGLNSFPRSAWECRLRRSASSSQAENHNPWDAAATGSAKPVFPISSPARSWAGCRCSHGPRRFRSCSIPGNFFRIKSA